MATRRLIGEIQATAELLGSPLSEGALLVLLSDLADYDENAILGALQRCRNECRGRLTPGDILTRIVDGHLSSDEAWAMMPRDEDVTIVWTDEMAAAWGIAKPLMDERDYVAARLAFRDAYVRAVGESRATKAKPKWRASLGRDPRGRRGPVDEAVRLGRLTAQGAALFLPPPDSATVVPMMIERKSAPLPAGEAAKSAMAKIRKSLSLPAPEPAK